jgi:hypothetical protein
MWVSGGLTDLCLRVPDTGWCCKKVTTIKIAHLHCEKMKNYKRLIFSALYFYFCALFAQLLPWRKTAYVVPGATGNMPQKPRQKFCISGKHPRQCGFRKRTLIHAGGKQLNMCKYFFVISDFVLYLCHTTI